ncbi:ferredoxin [Nocardia gamkensis]|uniref:ferredoxin n=1 Tax=Nocardia gamkensis TaxID=352869 RepID=UPI0033C0D640
MKIVVDYGKCTGLGICESFAPDIFEIDEAGNLLMHGEVVPPDMVDAVRAAVAGCPTEALRLVEE